MGLDLLTWQYGGPLTKMEIVWTIKYHIKHSQSQIQTNSNCHNNFAVIFSFAQTFLETKFHLILSVCLFQLLGGPNTMPDSVFVYRQNVETVGSSSSLQSGTGGNISFSFVHEKKVRIIASYFFYKSQIYLDISWCSNVYLSWDGIFRLGAQYHACWCPGS